MLYSVKIKIPFSTGKKLIKDNTVLPENKNNRPLSEFAISKINIEISLPA
jgi:hypothetical protein